jgi:general stress protein YciG
MRFATTTSTRCLLNATKPKQTHSLLQTRLEPRKMSSTANTNPGNFANRPKEEVQAIASKGGKSSHSGGFANMDPERQVCFSGSSALWPHCSVQALILGPQREIASEGGKASKASGNPGNFANRPKEEVREIASKGGQSSHSSGGHSDDSSAGGGNPGNFANR